MRFSSGFHNLFYRVTGLGSANIKPFLIITRFKLPKKRKCLKSGSAAQTKQNPLSFAQNRMMSSSKRLIIALLYTFPVWAMVACRNTADAPARNRQGARAAISLLDTTATASMQQLLYHYYDLKDALAATRSTAARGAAEAMQHQVSALRVQLEAADSNAAYLHALQSHLDTISGNLDHVLTLKDESCEQQRVYFKPISEALYDALKLIRIQHLTVYHTFCPMAFREKGAFWLSEFPEIRNPYFGAKMIECGEVIDTLR